MSQTDWRRLPACAWSALFLLSVFAAPVPAQKPAATAQPAGSTIVRDPSDLPGPLASQPLANLAPVGVDRVTLTAREVDAVLNPATGAMYHYWTFNGKVPGPMIRVREGDTVVVTLKNNPDSKMAHSIDLHAVIGTGGGAALMQVPPGEERTFSFVATMPGLFVYHCGTPMIAEHIANGMYGLILVEPRAGMPHVDHEYYVMQGEIYTSAPATAPAPSMAHTMAAAPAANAAHEAAETAAGPAPKPDAASAVLTLDHDKLMAETPQYFVLNGALGALTTQFPMRASVGQSVRIFFGNAGPNATASPHMVGEIFTRYYTDGSLLSPPVRGVQTATVPPGGAAIFEVKAEMPGQFAFMDHAIARMEKGNAAFLKVSGQDVAKLMYAGPNGFHGAIPALAITPEDAADAMLADVSTAPVVVAEAAAPVAVATSRVTMTESAFVPAVIEVPVGEAVTWINTAPSIHTAIDDAAKAPGSHFIGVPDGATGFASPFLLSGQSYTHVFTVPGVYHYTCTQHEHGGMVGTVIVKPAGRAAVAKVASRHP